MGSGSERLQAVERSLGVRVPEDYAVFVRDHRATSGNLGLVVSSTPDTFGVRALFELGPGAEHLQVDTALRLLGDVLPKLMLPIAEDEAGNLYLLDCGPERFGEVRWWNHERRLGDDSTEVVSPSFGGFLGSLMPDAD